MARSFLRSVKENYSKHIFDFLRALIQYFEKLSGYQTNKTQKNKGDSTISIHFIYRAKSKQFFILALFSKSQNWDRTAPIPVINFTGHFYSCIIADTLCQPTRGVAYDKEKITNNLKKK